MSPLTVYSQTTDKILGLHRFIETKLVPPSKIATLVQRLGLKNPLKHFIYE